MLSIRNMGPKLVATKKCIFVKMKSLIGINLNINLTHHSKFEKTHIMVSLIRQSVNSVIFRIIEENCEHELG